MIFESRSDDLLTVEEIFGPDESDDGVDQQRLQRPCDRVGARFEGLLVDGPATGPEVCARRQCRALPGLQIHHVVADGPAVQRPPGLIAFVENCQVDAESAVGALGARNRLEDQVDRCARLDQADRRGDVREHARLHRNIETLPHVVEEFEQRRRRLW
ncbi:Uncharacterised protein [Mycobacteroides abscessus subsp. abscessus]|nr:Uncharacterised protein [Mycobacteroides abscessus subsp. abscessus]